MSHSLRSALIALTAFVECALLIYLAFWMWLITAWFIDETSAFRLTDAGWYAVAGRRLVSAALVAAIFGGIVYAVNRLVAYVTGHRTSRIPRFSALAFAGIILLVSLVAAIQFVIKRPWL